MSLTTTFAPAAPSASASARPRPTPAPVTTATPPSSSLPLNDGTNGFTTVRTSPLGCGLSTLEGAQSAADLRSSMQAEHQGTGRDARAAGDQHVLGAGDLVDRRPADLPHAFGDAVHAVQVGLAELPAVGVDRQPAADLDPAVGNEVLRLTAT